MRSHGLTLTLTPTLTLTLTLRLQALAAEGALAARAGLRWELSFNPQVAVLRG